MKRITVNVFVGIIVFLITTAGGTAATAMKSPYGATKIHIEGTDCVSELSKTLVGDGVQGIEPLRTSATAGCSIHWVRSRDKVDDRGYRHVFFRQHYRPNSFGVGPAVPAVARDLQLDNAEVGLHYDPEGVLWLVSGAQFEDVVSTTFVVIDQAADAYALARVRASELSGFTPANPIDLVLDSVEADVAVTRLHLRSTGDGQSFRYVWKTPIRQESGPSLMATLDAETGELLSTYDPNPRGSCEPDTDSEDAAVGTSQRGTTRNVWATELQNPDTETHEAQRISSTSIPDIEIYYYSAFDRCNPTTAKYTMVTMPSVGGTPTYYNCETCYIGKAAADAIYFTYKTMQTFKDFGRNGWDGGGGTAKVVVNGNCGDNDAFFHRTATYDWIMVDAVAICEDESESLYAASAAIDIVGHEWGHGLIFEDVGWRYENDYPDEKVLHEAWADVIGHIVEWDHQSAGSQAEQADWEGGEDRGEAWRVADDYGSRVCRDSECESFHASDSQQGDTPHAIGNKLSVAFYLMSVGGENSICEYDDQLDGCGTDVTSAGVVEASEILFRVLTNYATQNSDFDDFANYARTAAFAVFADCPYYDAYYEQMAAIEAFTAIGHPPNYGFARWCN